MRLRELRDIYEGEDIYIIGAGPTLNMFPIEFLRDKICLSLNHAYKMHPAIGPIALMHHQLYAHAGDSVKAPYHPNFTNIKYPIVKGTSRDRLEKIDWEHEYFYYYDWSHDINNLWMITKDTDELIYTSEGCALHAALEVCWIMGARNIFTIGCDSRTMGNRHYADYDKDGFRDQDSLPTGVSRNYDSYVYGTLIIQEFLARKGINLFNISNIVGFHMIDYQFEVLSGNIGLDNVYQRVYSNDKNRDRN